MQAFSSLKRKTEAWKPKPLVVPKRLRWTKRQKLFAHSVPDSGPLLPVPCLRCTHAIHSQVRRVHNPEFQLMSSSGEDEDVGGE